MQATTTTSPATREIRDGRSHGAPVSKRRAFLAGLTILGLLMARPLGAQVRTIVADAGGTADFPPYATPGYQTAAEIRQVENGLPPGSELIGRLSLVDITHGVPSPGGTLGGTVHPFGGRLVLQLQGTGIFAAYNRTIGMPLLLGEAHAGPHPLGTLEQAFPATLFQLYTQLTGDPDFALLRLTAGDGFGLPAPGETTISPLPNGNWSVDSFFDLTYRVDFVGQPGGPFAGFSGSTVTRARIQEGRPMRGVCVGSDNLGTTDFPSGCGAYSGEPNADFLRSGLPLGAAVTARTALQLTPPFAVVAGGNLGGTRHAFGGSVELALVGNGALGSYARTLSLPLLIGEADLGPFTPSTSPQGAPADLARLHAEVTGDPDFALLRITAGTDFGLPSPGHRSLANVPGGGWAVDSFFDITYRVDFVGDPGGVFAGQSGSVVFTNRFEQGGPLSGVACDAPDVGGTSELPAPCAAGYAGPPDAACVLAGLPPGSPLHMSFRLDSVTPLTEVPGGALGGTAQTFKAVIGMKVEGFGAMAGYSRVLSKTAAGSSEAGPRTPGALVQSFPMALTGLSGSITGDPDFDLLRISIGPAYGMPLSPGHTALTWNGVSWDVDSFFDVTYRADFIGAPGGPFAGMSGSTTGALRLQAGEYGATSAVHDPGVPDGRWLSTATPNPTRGEVRLVLELERPSPVEAAVYDVVGRRVAHLGNWSWEAGRHEVYWNGLNSAGESVAAGLYFLRVERDGALLSRRVVRTE